MLSQRAMQAATNIQQYETEIVNKYEQMDLYRAVGKNYKQISFNDLTLAQNLNYIKYNLKNSHEAFKLYDITKDKF